MDNKCSVRNRGKRNHWWKRRGQKIRKVTLLGNYSAKYISWYNLCKKKLRPKSSVSRWENMLNTFFIVQVINSWTEYSETVYVYLPHHLRRWYHWYCFSCYVLKFGYTNIKKKKRLSGFVTLALGGNDANKSNNNLLTLKDTEKNKNILSLLCSYSAMLSPDIIYVASLWQISLLSPTHSPN